MYAVIKTGGKQYRVAAGDKIQIEKLEGNPGDQVKFAEVLMMTWAPPWWARSPPRTVAPTSSSSRSAAASTTAGATATVRT